MPDPFIHLLRKYLNICALYGVLHSVPRAYYRKDSYLRSEHVDALLVDKFAYCLQSACIAPLVWPHYVYADARAVELILRGKTKDEYPSVEFP